MSTIKTRRYQVHHVDLNRVTTQAVKMAARSLAFALLFSIIVPAHLLPTSNFESHINVCDNECECDTLNSTARCESVAQMQLSELIAALSPHIERLHVSGANYGNITEANFDAINGTYFLRSLSIFDSNVTSIEPMAFAKFPNLEELDLSNNKIRNISYLGDLRNLRSLNLSHNLISVIDAFAFRSLRNLDALDLSYNMLTILSSPKIMFGLGNLERLSLNNNQLSFLHPALFARQQQLTYLNLNSNFLESLGETLFDNTSLAEVHLGDNPWYCHCGVDWLVIDFQNNEANQRYVNSDAVRCNLPQHLSQLRIQDLDASQLVCQEPQFDLIPPESVSFEVWHSYVINCNGSGYPAPTIYWEGPRGVLVHPSQQLYLPAHIEEYSQVHKFSGYPYREAKVRALANGSLEFVQFRKNYIGNYTCFVINPMSSSSVNVTVEIRSEIYKNVVISAIFGLLVAVVFMVFGMIVGAIRMCADRCCVNKCCCAEEHHVYYGDENYEDEAEFWDEYFRHPLDSNRATPDVWPSPVKCITPVELEPYDPKLSDFNKSIFNTLNAVRTRLNTGMGRHMDSMRERADHMRLTGKNLRIDVTKRIERVRYKAYLMRESAGIRMTNLRESSSQTLRNFRSSSGQYAHRMREGMGVRVEAVKYSVKSLKEFCGAGNLGQTMSVPSMSTNVDSQESEPVYKTITFV